MLRCKEATHLISQQQDRQLAAGERLQLKLHLAMCSGCRNFRAQMNFLRAACKQYPGDQGGEDQAKAD